MTHLIKGISLLTIIFIIFGPLKADEDIALDKIPDAAI